MLRFFIALFVFITIILVRISFNIGQYIVLYYLIFISFTPFIYVSFLFGFNRTKNAISIPFKKEPEKIQLRMALNYFRLFGNLVWLNCLLMLLISYIGWIYEADWGGMTLEHFNDVLAIFFLQIFYAVLITLLIIRPFQAFIQIKLVEE